MKKILALLLSLLLVSLCSTSLLANDVKVVDETGVLTSEEISEIERNCRQFTQYTDMDCVVFITYQEGVNVQHLADNFYDMNGYGVGPDREGIILCINYGTRDYTISTCGPKTIDTFTDYAQENYLYDSITPLLGENRVGDACNEFVLQALSIYRNYDYFHPQEEVLSFKDKLTRAMGFGGFGAVISTLASLFSKKGQLKSTGEKRQANSYITNAKIDMFRSGDVHMYTNVLRRRIEKNDGGGRPSKPSSHSSTHISHSGVTHGGTGGHKF